MTKAAEKLEKKSEEASSPQNDRWVVMLGWVYVACVLGWIVHRVWPALFLPWWFNTDEVVMYYEALRQLRLDPSQTFFDIPGTPYILLTSLTTAVWWFVDRIFHLTAAGSPAAFAFANIQGVFTLMRGLTLGLYVVAAAIAYDLFRRCAGVFTAIVATILFASLPAYVTYSYFVRTESLGLVLSLGAIWIVLYSRWKGTPQIYAVAGALAGVAMAARFHFALVALPVILCIFFLRDRKHLPLREPVRTGILFQLGTIAGAGLCVGALIVLAYKFHIIEANRLTRVLMITTSAGPAEYAGAKAFVAKLWLVLGGGAALLLLTHRSARGRRWTLPVVNPFTLAAILGFGAGFIISHPEFLWRGQYQLRSIQFYSDWTDAQLTSLGVLASWWTVTSYYFTNAFPERWIQVSFFAGIALMLWHRRGIPIALGVGAVLCFFAHPLRMKLWPHHVIPWLPLLCFIAAQPIGATVTWLVQHSRYQRVMGVITLSLLTGGIVWGCRPRFKDEGNYFEFSRARTDQIGEMSRWLSKNVPVQTYVLESYYALTDDGFLKWIEDAGVRLPDHSKKYPDLHIWWLEPSAVDGREGVLCTSREDIRFFRGDLERRNPGSTYDPFENRNFTPVARFGSGVYELTIFKFDCRGRSCAQ